MLRKIITLTTILYCINFFNILVLNHIILTKLSILVVVIYLFLSKISSKNLHKHIFIYVIILIYFSSVYWQFSSLFYFKISNYVSYLNFTNVSSFL